MKTQNTDKATASKWQLDCVPDANGFHTVRPFDGTLHGDTNQLIATFYDLAHADLAVRAVNAYNPEREAALVEVAEAAKNHRIAKAAYLARESSGGLCDVMNNCEDILNQALANLAKIRGGAK